MILCEYGCGKEGKYINKNGKWCCSKSPNSCINIRKKCSAGLRKAHADGKMSIKHLDNVRAWSKGKTSLNDPRIRSTIRDNFDKYFCKHDKYIKIDAMKLFLKRTELIKYECYICKLKEKWQKKELKLHLDHIDGDRKNNNLTNLRWLCPNCHSQTITYCKAKNNVQKKYVSEEQLITHIKESNSMTQVLKKAHLSLAGLHYERIKNVMEKHRLCFYNVKPHKCISCGTRIGSKNKTGFCLKCNPVKAKKSKNAKKRIKCKNSECSAYIKKNQSGYCRPCYNKIVNVKIKERPDAQTLLQEVIKSPMLQVGKKYGVSDSAIRKWLKSYGLPHRSSDLKKLKKIDEKPIGRELLNYQQEIKMKDKEKLKKWEPMTKYWDGPKECKLPLATMFENQEKYKKEKIIS